MVEMRCCIRSAALRLPTIRLLCNNAQLWPAWYENRVWTVELLVHASQYLTMSNASRYVYQAI